MHGWVHLCHICTKMYMSIHNVLLFIVVYWVPTNNNECLVSPGLEIRKPNIGSLRESQHTHKHTHMYRWKHGGIIGGFLGKKIGLKCSLKNTDFHVNARYVESNSAAFVVIMAKSLCTLIFIDKKSFFLATFTVSFLRALLFYILSNSIYFRSILMICMQERNV
jgi:hypothetical protein